MKKKTDEEFLNEHRQNIGKKFGRLTVKDVYIVKGKDRRCMYVCDCDCGKEKVALYDNIISGKTQSCGCLQKDQVYKSNYVGNTYEEHDDYVKGYTTKGEEFYIDKDDFDLVKPYTWSINSKGYLRANVNRDPGTRMHRFILGLDKEDKRVVDHINHNIRDNRKSNLRICTPKENCWNSSPNKNSKSGVRGVSWDGRGNKWVVYLKKNGKRTYLGSSRNLNEAIEMRKKAELEMLQEFGYHYSMKLSPQIRE